MPQPRFAWRLPALWTRLLLASILVLMATTTSRALAATTPPGRWATVGVTGGARIFSSSLDLENEFAIGARVVLGLSDRVSIGIDGGHSSPTRRSSDIASSFGEVRAIASYRFLTGSVRPYLMTGVGGQFFNFHDAPGAAGAVVAAGAGVECSLGEVWSVVGEGSVDFYRARYQTFSDTGEVIDSTEPLTYGTGILTLGLQIRF